eukprot:11547-Heterococcus_DN1.PRE.2
MLIAHKSTSTIQAKSSAEGPSASRFFPNSLRYAETAQFQKVQIETVVFYYTLFASCDQNGAASCCTSNAVAFSLCIDAAEPAKNQ